MKACFIHRSGPTLASFRYRAEIPAKAIGASLNGGEAQVLIFSKPTHEDLALAKDMKAEGLRIIADLGDDHFNHATWGPVYREMVQLADALVVPTENMAGRMKKYFDRKIDAVIPDPYEEPFCAPHADGERYLWFGNPVNLKDLRPWMEYLKRVDLTIVTGKNPGFPHSYIPWSLEVQTAQLQQANIVLLPVRKGVEYKSPNRLVNAIRAGCFVVGSDHPSHKEFRQFVWTGNFSTGLKWAQHFHTDLNALVKEGQRYIEKYSPENVGKLWTQVIEAVCV